MSWIDPHRLIEKTAIIYCEEEGGETKILFGYTKQAYEKILEDGFFIGPKTSDADAEIIAPRYITFANMEDGYDFQIEKINEKNGYPKDYTKSKLEDYLQAHR